MSGAPGVEKNLRRSAGCGELRPSHVGQEVVVTGWVAGSRDLGKLTFVDLRDRTGLCQVVVNADESPSLQAEMKGLRSEDVVGIRGRVTARQAVNPNIPTGEVEVVALDLAVHNRADTPPFAVADDTSASEELRLKHRHLDLRRPRMQRILVLRHKVALATRTFLDGRGFLEIETPMLTRSTPEGARDYLVPSRVFKGRYFALPQSPQLFKQLLMVSGLERYFQIVRCFRDEDLRADRQPEFTQVDIEMSFVRREDVMALVEPLVVAMAEAAGVPLPHPFPRLSYAAAMATYGSDKPDLRFALPIEDVSPAFRESPFAAFRAIVAGGGAVRAIRVPAAQAGGEGAWSRKVQDELQARARELGATGLVVARAEGSGLKSPIVKHLGDGGAALRDALHAGEGDAVVMVADASPEKASVVLGDVRLDLARRLSLVPAGAFAPLWVNDFPLFTFDREEGRHVANHHPFTSPLADDLPLLDAEPFRARAEAYDLVLNGYEIGGGSIRIHDRKLQARIFELIGIGPEEARAKFGFLLDALASGAPPHGGIALGLDRIVMILSGASSLREVIAFPKTTSSSCLLTGAPATVDARQLAEIGIAALKTEP